MFEHVGGLLNVMKMSFYGAFDYTFSLPAVRYDSVSLMTRMGDFVEDPNKRRLIAILRRVRLMIVREIIDTKYALKCI